MVRILLFGADGQLGHELRGPLGSTGELAALGRADCDVTDRAALEGAVKAARPHLIVNATAFSAVDRAEDEPDTATAVNATAVLAMGEIATKARAGLIHVSTDYVFDGQTPRPYTEDDEPAPLSTYARTKLAGEEALLTMSAPAIILRTSWVFSRRPCFLTSMLALAAEREELQVTDDQISCPTFARDLGVAIGMIAHTVRDGPHAALTEWQGVYHLAGQGTASRWELLREAVACSPQPLKVREVRPVPSSTFPSRAVRPMYSALDSSRAEQRFGIALPHWRDALRRALAL